MSDPAHNAPQPSEWVTRHIDSIPAGGRVLDLACGSGRHTRLLHSLGYRVVAVDKDLRGVQDLRDVAGIELLQMDLEQPDWPLQDQQFASIVVCNYLYRPHLAKLADCLEDSGCLLYETFAAGNERYGKPTNPDYLLEPGELLDVFGRSLKVVAFEQGLIQTPQTRLMQRICARKVR